MGLAFALMAAINGSTGSCATLSHGLERPHQASPGSARRRQGFSLLMGGGTRGRPGRCCVNHSNTHCSSDGGRDPRPSALIFDSLSQSRALIRATDMCDPVDQLMHRVSEWFVRQPRTEGTAWRRPLGSAASAGWSGCLSSVGSLCGGWLLSAFPEFAVGDRELLAEETDLFAEALIVLERSAKSRAGAGRRPARNSGPLGRPAISRGSSRAEPDWRCSHSVSPPLERTRARLFSRSTSSTFSERTSCARAAVSYNSRQSAFSRTATSSAPEPLELQERDRPRPIRRLTPTRQHIRKRFGHPALAGAERRERPQRRDVTIPRRRRAPAPRPDGGPLQLATGDPLQRTLGSELAPQAAERLRIGASAREREIGLNEKRIDGLSKGRRLLPRRTQPPTRPPRRAHRRECVIFTDLGGGLSVGRR